MPDKQLPSDTHIGELIASESERLRSEQEARREEAQALLDQAKALKAREDEEWDRECGITPDMSFDETLERWRPKERWQESDWLRAQGANLSELAEYPDEQVLVIDFYPSTREPVVATAGELRDRVRNMKNPDLWFGMTSPQSLAVVSDNPEKYTNKKNEEVERWKRRYLDAIAGLPDDHVVWYATGKTFDLNIKKTTAGHIRDMVQQADAMWIEGANEENNFIVSTDPDFDPDAWQNERSKRFFEQMGSLTGKISEWHGIRSKIIERLGVYAPTARVRVRFPGTPDGAVMTIEDAVRLIDSMGFRDAEEFGLPTFEVEDLRAVPQLAVKEGEKS